MQTTGEHDYWQNAETADKPVLPSNSQYAGYGIDEAQPNVEPRPVSTPASLSWEASEYVHNEKTVIWFVVLGGITVVLAATAYFLMKSLTFTLLIFVMAAAIGVYSRRPPRSLHYTLEPDHLVVEDKLYPYGQFKSFAIVQDGPLSYIMLQPVQRFSPAVTIYFPAESGEQIVAILSSVLPLETRELDFMDRLVRKIGF